MSRSRDIGVCDKRGAALRLVIKKDAKGRLHVEIVDIKCLLAYPPIVGSLDRIERKLKVHVDATAARTVRKQIEHYLGQGVL